MINMISTAEIKFKRKKADKRSCVKFNNLSLKISKKNIYTQWSIIICDYIFAIITTACIAVMANYIWVCSYCQHENPHRLKPN